jgi:hypothetical protein
MTNTSNNFKEEHFEVDAQWCKIFNGGVDKGFISIITMLQKKEQVLVRLVQHVASYPD